MSAVLNTGALILAGGSQLFSIIPQGNIGGITVDATFEEIYEDTVEATEHPVEYGADVTDHSFKRPVEFTLRCGWSNSTSQVSEVGSALAALVNPSLNAAITSAAAVNTIQSFLGSTDTPAAIGNSSMSVSDYVTGIYQQLLSLQYSRQLFTVVGTLRTYQNMLMRSLRVERDPKSSQALYVRASFREVILVSAQTTTLPPQQNQATPQATAETLNSGQTSLVTGNPAQGGSLPPSLWGGS